ncbi:hypothetical protein QBC39DRAFT_437289 [Podospora conica]|nr:hypothetical protein QBC39DRAFT_437289 [Schizothecium conicum]
MENDSDDPGASFRPSPTTNKTCTDLVPFCPPISRVPGEIILLICEEVYDNGHGRSDLSRLSRTCHHAHEFILPLLYKEIKATAGCCRPIPGRYEPSAPCSCSDERRETGFPRLNHKLLHRTLWSYPRLASLVQRVDIDPRKKSAAGGAIFDDAADEASLPGVFLLPCIKSIKIPVRDAWAKFETWAALAARAQSLGMVPVGPNQTLIFGFPTITHLHLSNARQVSGWFPVWALLCGCFNVEVLFIEKLWSHYWDCHKFRLPKRSILVGRIRLFNLTDLDIVHSQMDWYELPNLVSSRRLRSVSLVQFQPHLVALSTHPVSANREGLISPGPGSIIKFFLPSAGTLENLSVAWAHKDFVTMHAAHPDKIELIKSMSAFPALRLLELSYAQVEKSGEDVLVNLIKGCKKLEALKLIGITTMPERELYRFAFHVSELWFPALRMLKLCTNMNDGQAWEALKMLPTDEIVSLLAEGRVKLVLRPYHRKPGDPRFPELGFEGDIEEMVPPES